LSVYAKEQHTEKCSPHTILMRAIAHEFLENSLDAMESYLHLARKNSKDASLNYVQKAETLAKDQQDVLFYLEYRRDCHFFGDLF
jgi:hypothetical protein